MYDLRLSLHPKISTTTTTNLSTLIPIPYPFQSAVCINLNPKIDVQRMNLIAFCMFAQVMAQTQETFTTKLTGCLAQDPEAYNDANYCVRGVMRVWNAGMPLLSVFALLFLTKR